MWFVILALFPPALAAGWIARHARPTWPQWRETYLPRLAILTALGVMAGAPFFGAHALGTSEAFNYSMATADAVTQVRQGVFPVFVGQSEYAFMGRIHPLRTAPYMAYFAIALDTVSLRSLDFWSLQNLTLLLSLIAAAFSTYFSLRRVSGVSARWGLILTGAYLLSPGVLSLVYAMDLYMTVMAVPYLPVIIALNLRLLRADDRPRIWLGLGAALAAVWTAHPPVALWASLLTVALQTIPVACRILRRDTRALSVMVAATAWGGAMAAFALTSALTISSYGDITNAKQVGTLLQETSRFFVDSLRPISAEANRLSDFQLGYAFWAGLALAGLQALRQLRAPNAPQQAQAGQALALLGAAGALLLLVVPVPVVHAAIWEAMPTFVVNVSNQWPMQRLYVILATLIVFAVALTWPSGQVPRAWPKFLRDAGQLLLFAALSWTLWQAWSFIGRGWGSRQTPAYSARLHADENLNPTLISYAIVGTPSNFVNGVTDPEMELRLLAKETLQVSLTNWDVTVDGARPRAGTFRSRQIDPTLAVLSPDLRLEPGLRYRLDFDFKSPPVTGVLQLLGPTMLRNYPLPSAGAEDAFGMAPGNRRALPVWTSQTEAETIRLQVVTEPGASIGSGNFADFRLTSLQPEYFPLRIESLIPLRVRVQAPTAALLATTRMDIPGYRATVNGKPERVFRAPDRVVMIPVPAGESIVELSYPGELRLRLAFWLSLIAWVGLAGAMGFHFVRPDAPGRLAALLARGRTLAMRQAVTSLHVIRARWRLSAVIVCLLVVTPWIFQRAQDYRHWRDAAGPIRLKVMLPRDVYGRALPILTTGEPEAGTFIFLKMTDPTHIQIGVDVWNKAYWLSEPIPVDYYQPQELVFSSAALYPPGHPKLDGIDPSRLEELRQRITVDLNGVRVVEQPWFSFESSVDMVFVGVNRIGGSSTDPSFVGEILEEERLLIAP